MTTRRTAREPWKHGYKRANGIRQHYVIAGKGPALILLHGWPQTWYCWRKLIPLLAERFQVIAPDLRGFGDTDKPESGYDKKSVAKDIYELAAELGHRRAIVAGQDWGGRVVWRLALDYPEFAHRLVVMSAPYPLLRSQRPFNPESWYTWFFTIPDLPERMLASNSGDFITHFLLRWSYNKKHYTRADLAEYKRAFSSPEAIKGYLHHYRLLDEDTRAWQREDAGRTVTQPTLYMAGEHDPVSPPAGADGLLRYVRDVRFAVIKEAGHFIQEEKPEDVAREILGFCS